MAGLKTPRLSQLPSGAGTEDDLVGVDVPGINVPIQLPISQLIEVRFALADFHHRMIRQIDVGQIPQRDQVAAIGFRQRRHDRARPPGIRQLQSVRDARLERGRRRGDLPAVSALRRPALLPLRHAISRRRDRENGISLRRPLQVQCPRGAVNRRANASAVRLRKADGGGTARFVERDQRRHLAFPDSQPYILYPSQGTGRSRQRFFPLGGSVRQGHSLVGVAREVYPAQSCR